jgi:hypothetical protein
MHKQHFQQQLNTPVTAMTQPPTLDSIPVFSLSVDVNEDVGSANILSTQETIAGAPVEAHSSRRFKENNENSGSSSGSSSSGSSSSSASSTTNEYMDLHVESNDQPTQATLCMSNEARVPSADSPNSEDIHPISVSSTSCGSSVCGSGHDSNEQVADLPTHAILNDAEAFTSLQSETNRSDINNFMTEFKPRKLARAVSLTAVVATPTTAFVQTKTSISVSDLIGLAFSHPPGPVSNEAQSSEYVYLNIFESRNHARMFISKSETNLASLDDGELFSDEIKAGGLLFVYLLTLLTILDIYEYIRMNYLFATKSSFLISFVRLYLKKN